MENEGPNWEGLLKWSIAHSDGTRPSQKLSEEDQRWFMEAMQAQTVDVGKRMKEIILVMETPEQVLEAHGITAADIEDMLDELQEHVESIDMANNLHSIGGLIPLLGCLKNAHANIRAKAADILTTIVQNNHRSQQLVMEANGLEPLLSNFTSDPDVIVRTKALGAISSLIRDNKPGIAAFRLANGYGALRDALSSENVRFQSEDAEVREVALRGLLELARDRPCGRSSLSEDEEQLKQILQDRIEGIGLMSSEDLAAAREERQLVDSLWNVYYKEPSSLRENGLLFPGEDAPPPDVAGKLFEPPLRAWDAKRATDTDA
ncbi:hsp70 nucleotide exchange factor FES1-like isoform X2 [Actinidia eriantha]|uniref:hsp70 nucleotide exchange factor FES1-like isoform X2 n=1 Tax=Actinidia eriantha TaxID=165200 RepID=UPI00259034FD|nr:hsp70 nucleotide exchange factor FES1-like isoform X2 [Actinidia eriantha]